MAPRKTSVAKAPIDEADGEDAGEKNALTST